MKRVVLAATFLFVFTGCPDPPRVQPCDPPCGEFQQCVDGFCRDASCRPPCREGRVCVQGFCVRVCDPEIGDECGLSETCCAHIRACVDTDTDFFNCGGCGDICPTVRSNICFDARCGCSGFSDNSCGEGFGCCEGGCKDLRIDPENCGSCGHSCGELQCVDGECRCSTDEPCPETEECCPDGCRNLNTDSQNCGECGKRCVSGQDCCDGECVNTLVDLSSCGDCGNTCDEGNLCCIGTCIDPLSDPFNCGDCLVDCGVGGSCNAGSCE